MALNEADAAEKALRTVRATGTQPWRDWQRRLLVSTHCEPGTARDWGYWTALCFDHLLAVSKDADSAMRNFAAVEMGNAHARGDPG